MTDKEIDELIAEIDELAKRINCRFVPDPDKLMAFRCAQREEQSVRDHYRAERRKIMSIPDTDDMYRIRPR